MNWGENGLPDENENDYDYEHDYERLPDWPVRCRESRMQFVIVPRSRSRSRSRPL